MNRIFIGFAFSALISGAAFAQTNDNVKINFSEDAEKAFVEKYGIDEKSYIEKTVREELKKAIGDGFNIEIFVESATPNRPTMFQMSKNPSLSYQSFSTGGANLKGVVLDKDGKEVANVKYEYSTPFIYDAQYYVTWRDADWAIERFANALKKSIQ